MALDKRILFVTRFFPPEPGAAQERIRAFAMGLAKKSYNITVLTTYPSYPTYTKNNTFEEDEFEDNITVIRIWTPRLGRRFRLITDVYFSIASAVRLIWIKKPQYLVISSPPFFLGFTALFLKKTRRVPYIFDIRDLYPDSLIDIGFIRNIFLKRILYYMELVFYRQAYALLVVSNTMKKRIDSKGVTTPIYSLYNGVDIDLFHDNQKRYINDVKKYFNTSNKKILYIGNLGQVYSFNILLKSAKQLEKIGWDIMLFGDGSKKENIIRYIKEHKLDNVTIINPIPSKYVPSLLAHADAAFVALLDIPITKGSLPTKMFEYMAAELPILANLHGEAENVFKNYYKPISSADDIVNILKLESHTTPIFNEKFSRKASIEQLNHIISNI